MSGTPILEVGKVSRIYRKGGLFTGSTFKAVDDVSFTLPDKPQVFSIVGESGSGKTTIARMVLRLVEPSAGSIRLLGRPLSGKGEGRIDALEFRRLVQPIFQNPFEAFSAYLPIEDYLRRTAINLKVARNASEANDLADKALRSVGLSLDRIRGKFIRQFSGGELQRISVARALIPRPKLIVADEPVSMVDASLRMSIVNLFRQIVEEQGVSFIYITHDLSTAYYLSDQVAIMNRGRVVEQGPPTDILDNPSEAYTRELMAAIPGVQWVPDWGRARIEGMIGGRPDWCISRQRTWGVPITLFVHRESGELHPETDALIEQVARARADRLVRRERIGDAVFGRHFRQQLHHALRALGRHRMRIEAALRVRDRAQPRVVDLVRLRRGLELLRVHVQPRRADVAQAVMRRRTRRRLHGERQHRRRARQVARAVHGAPVLLALVQRAVDHAQLAPQVRHLDRIVLDRLRLALRTRLRRGG